MKVNKIMHLGVEWSSPETLVTALAKKMKENDIGAIPIGENDKLVGMVTDRDIIIRALANGKDISKLKARDVMTKGIVWCRSDSDIQEAVDIMETKKIRRLPIIDENKRMVGMLSLGDISHAASGKLTSDALRAVSAHHA